MAKKKESESESEKEKENEQPNTQVKEVSAKETGDEETVKEPTELEKLTALAEDYKRKWYSVSAEYDNYRKRNATATSQAYQDGRNDTLLKLLPIADSFCFALATADEKTKAGIEKIIKNFNAIIESFGVTEIPINIGDEFHEDFAEAIMSVPCEEGDKPHTIKQIMKKGYKSGEKVIRFAQVVVAI